MKRCPKCNLRFDESLNYCLEDGSPLLEDEQETVLIPIKNRRDSRFKSITKTSVVILLALFAGGVIVYLSERGFSVGADIPSANSAAKIDEFPTIEVSPSLVAVVQTPSPSPSPIPIDRKSEINNLVGFIGKYPYQLFKARPAFKQRFRMLLGGDFKKFDNNLSVQVPFTVEGNAMFSAGCAAHSCGSEEAALAIDLSSGVISCAYFSAPFNTRTLEYGRPRIRSFSEDKGALSTAIRQKIQQWSDLSN